MMPALSWEAWKAQADKLVWLWNDPEWVTLPYGKAAWEAGESPEQAVDAELDWRIWSKPHFALIPERAMEICGLSFWEDLLWDWREQGKTDGTIRAQLARFDWPRIIAEHEAFLRGERDDFPAFGAACA